MSARENVSDLIAFLAVARTGSFTRAAQQLGVSQPALSHALKGLEGRLGLRLLNRTTRSVSTTEAGERLLRTIAPHFDGIEAGLAALTELRDKPAGTVRITIGDQPAESILLPAVARLLPAYPNLNVEIITNDFGQYGISMYNVFGQKVLTKEFTVNTRRYVQSLNIANLMKGVYYVAAFGKDGKKIQASTIRIR